MKKSLSLLLAIALVFSMFSSLAFAAEQSSGEYLKEIGVIKGNSSGDLMEDKTWKRQDVVVILSRLLGQEEEAQNTAKNHPFTDVTNPYYDSYITWARDNGYFEGKSATRFGYNDEIELYDFLAVMLRALGYDTKGANYANVDDLALELGWIDEDTDLDVTPTRGVLYDYVVATLNSETVDGEILGAKLGLPGFEEEVPEQSITVSAVGAQKLGVTFASAVDKSKAQIAVKKGNFPVNIKEVTYASDNKSATIVLSTKLTKGDYTVTVTGIADTALSQTVSVEDERVASLEITNTKAPLKDNNNKSIYVFISAKNQYGEDVTGNYTYTYTVSKGTPGTLSNGKLDINLPSTDGSTYTIGEKVTFSVAYVGNGTSAFDSEILEVSPVAKVATIDFTELYNKDGNQLKTNSNASDFYIVVDAKDQYGNPVTATQLNSDVVVSVAGDSYVTKGTFVTIPDTGKLGLQLAAPANGLRAGTATFLAVSTSSGGNDRFDVTVAEAPKLDVLTLSAPEIAVAGERVEIPFTALDQFGNPITSETDIEAGLTGSPKINVSMTGVNVDFVQDYVENKAKLYLDAAGVTSLTSPQSVFINAVTSTGKMATLTVTLQPKAKPVVITEVTGVTGAIAQGGSTKIERGNIKVLDQYGRTKSAADFNDYYVKVESSNGNVVVTTNQIDETATTSVLKAGTEGSATITLKLFADNGNAHVDNGDYVFTVKTVTKSSIVNYEVGAIDTLYTGGSAYARTLNVNGLLADGTKVAVPANGVYFSIVNGEDDLKLTVNTAVYVYNIYAESNLKNEIEGEGTFAIVVNAYTKDNIIPIPVSVKVSEAAPAAATLTLRSNGAVTKLSDNMISISATAVNGLTEEGLADLAVEIKDQYGFEITTSKFLSVTAQNFSNPAHNISNVAPSETFNVVAVTPNSKVITFKVLVTN